MGLFGARNKDLAPLRPEQKWDAITLKDFKSKSWWNGAAYGYLWFSLFLSVIVYGVDTFTAVNLLAFDNWSGSVKPTDMVVPQEYIKWIFSICIILSFINVGYEHFRAFRIRRRGSVAECFLDSLAVRLESARMGETGQGWRRFLVFAALTKSKKGAEYVALFTYFSFQSWVRVIICSGPRQFINATTLYAIYQSNLIPNDVSTVQSTLSSFFAKLDTLYAKDVQQALILSAMLFTLIIWIFSALYLIIAVFFYVFFLWHYIPKADGGLHGYCERKVNKRLVKIVAKKVNKALAKHELKQHKADVKMAMKTGADLPTERRQATLPDLFPKGGDDKLPEMPGLERSDTNPLPPYTSRPGTPQGIELSSFDQNRRMPPSRTATMTTMSTVSSGSSRAPGYRTASPAPTVPAIDYNQYPPPVRPGSSASNRTLQSSQSQLGRIATSGPGFGSQTPAPAPGFGPGPVPMAYTSSPAPYSALDSPGTYSRVASPAPSIPAPIRSPTGGMDPYGRPMPRPTPRPTPGPMSGRPSPAPSSMYPNRGPPPPMNGRGYNGPGYSGPGYNPMRSNTNPISSPMHQQFPPQRNMTAPVPPRQDYGEYEYDMDIESQRGARPRW